MRLTPKEILAGVVWFVNRNAFFGHFCQFLFCCLSRLCYTKASKFTVPKFFVLSVLLLLCFSCSTQATQSQQPSSPWSATQPDYDYGIAPLVDSFEADTVTKAAKPVPNTVSMSFGPKLLELKASYFEKGQQILSLDGTWQQNNNVQRFLDVLGSSSLGGTGFTGEGELTYSPLDSSPGQHLNVEWPKMLRLGIKNRWSGISFGADYRSIDQGFISTTGARTDQARDEGQFWGESAIGPFNLRGSVAQSWERFLGTDGVQISRTATASLNLNQTQWGGTLTSSYALVDPALPLDPSAIVLTNSLIGSYRPLKSFSLGPSLTMKQEWNRSGVRTQSPATGFAFAYAPARDPYKLTAGTSFTRSFSTDGARDLKALDTTAAFDWRLGKFLGREDVLSFNLKYNYQLDLVSPLNSRHDLTGMLQLKIVGF